VRQGSVQELAQVGWAEELGGVKVASNRLQAVAQIVAAHAQQQVQLAQVAQHSSHPAQVAVDAHGRPAALDGVAGAALATLLRGMLGPLDQPLAERQEPRAGDVIRGLHAVLVGPLEETVCRRAVVLARLLRQVRVSFEVAIDGLGERGSCRARGAALDLHVALGQRLGPADRPVASGFRRAQVHGVQAKPLGPARIRIVEARAPRRVAPLRGDEHHARVRGADAPLSCRHGPQTTFPRAGLGTVAT
jgi:hypothetical protein